MDIAQIRADMAELLANIDGLRVSATVPDQINGNLAVIYPDNFAYHDTYDGGENPLFVVQLLTPRINAVVSQTKLDGWIAPGTGNSVADAIETDSRFRVQEMRNYGSIVQGDGGSRYDTAELVVNVLA